MYLHVATIAFRLLLLLRAHNRMRFTTREGLQMLEENSNSTDINLTFPMTANSQMKTAILK